MILKIFDYLRRHAFARWASLLAITLILVASIVRLSYKEDIEDFLPLSNTDRERMAVYQDISGMNRLFVVFESSDDAEQTTEAIEHFVSIVEKSDTANRSFSLKTTTDEWTLSFRHPTSWTTSLKMTWKP